MTVDSLTHNEPDWQIIKINSMGDVDPQQTKPLCSEKADLLDSDPSLNIEAKLNCGSSERVVRSP